MDTIIILILCMRNWETQQISDRLMVGKTWNLIVSFNLIHSFYYSNFIFRKQILDSRHRHPTSVTQACLLVLLVAKESKHSKALRWSKEATLWIPAREMDIRPWNLSREQDREEQIPADTRTPTGTASPSLGLAK